jgi:tetratricopeptide (TPR) repeat protein
MIKIILNYKYKWQFLLISIVFITFFNTLNNDFTNWDDPYYITDNQLIKSFSLNNIKQIFSQDFTGTYVPLSVLSFSIDYQIGGTNPFIYHFTNLLLHLSNVLLVFYFIRNLISDNSKAFIVALLFGISTMQVESVAWITERKDLLYTFFYLLSLLQYIQYKKYKKYKYLFYTFGLFILSLFSKSQAVTLPLVLIFIDLFKNADLKNKKIWIEKIPFILLSFVFGIIAINFTKSAFSEGMNYTFFERLILSGNAFVIYIVKLFIPYNQSAIYSYPFKTGEISILSILFSLFTLIYLYLIYFFYKRNKIIFFGLLFFIINIALMLQVFPVGIAYMADRFSYLASIGLFLLIADFYFYILAIFPKLKKILFAIALIYLHLLGLNTILRNNVWADSLSLWDDTIAKNPTEATAYINRGNANKNINKFNEANADYTKAILINPTIPDAFFARGVLYASLNKTKESINDYNSTLQINPEYIEAYINLGNIYLELKDYSNALNKFDKALNINNKYYKAYIGRGNVKMQQNDIVGAMEDFNSAQNLKPDEAEIYYNRANAYISQGNLQSAIIDYNYAIKYNSNVALYFLNRGNTKFYLKDMNGALSDLNTAINLNPKIADYYYNRGNVKLYSNDIQSSISDYNQCITINPMNAEAYHKRGFAHLQAGMKQNACEDFNKAFQLGLKKAQNEINKYCK